MSAKTRVKKVDGPAKTISELEVKVAFLEATIQTLRRQLSEAYNTLAEEYMRKEN